MQVVFLALVGLQGLGIFSSPSFAAWQEEWGSSHPGLKDVTSLSLGRKSP